MSPPSFSSSKGKGIQVSKKSVGDTGKESSNQSVNGITSNNGKDALNPSQDQRRTSFARSPSGLSLSRPKSLLAPSRPSPLTPSVSSTTPDNNQPPHLLSASPSSRSIVDRNHANGITSSSSITSINNREGRNGDNNGTRTVSDGGALSRLRRVASNANGADLAMIDGWQCRIFNLPKSDPMVCGYVVRCDNCIHELSMSGVR